MKFTPEKALELLEENVKDEYQILHAKMVAEAMKAYASKLNEDENLWYITGLVHDMDYYNHPTEHPNLELEWYKQWEYPEELIHAVQAHAYERTGVEPKTQMAAALIACDELSGFLYAYSLMRPEGFEGMSAKSVKKKFKDKAFAKKVSRDDVKYGIEKFGVDFNDHVSFLIEVFQEMKELN